jgi:hypothetical protein
LGLYIARELADYHGWTLDLMGTGIGAQPGRGALAVRRQQLGVDPELWPVAHRDGPPA